MLCPPAGAKYQFFRLQLIDDNFFDIKRGFWIQICKILPKTTLIMLQRTMYLGMILLLVKYRFQNSWSDGKHMLKYGQ